MDILYPEFEWEGTNYPIVESGPGYLIPGGQELRDPDLFRDEDGQVYLLYTGGGEAAIGIARIEGLLCEESRQCQYSSDCPEIIRAYPNPLKGDILHLTGLPVPCCLSVYSNSGKKLIQKFIQLDTYQLSLSGIPKGLVFISIFTNERLCWFRIVRY